MCVYVCVAKVQTGKEIWTFGTPDNKDRTSDKIWTFRLSGSVFLDNQNVLGKVKEGLIKERERGGYKYLYISDMCHQSTIIDSHYDIYHSGCYMLLHPYNVHIVVDSSIHNILTHIL